MISTGDTDPHGDQSVRSGGAPLSRAKLALVMLHGRGGSPDDMLGLAAYLGLPDIAWLAPAAPGRSWWPLSFLAPLRSNEPGLSFGLRTAAAVVNGLNRDGFGPDRVVVMGFSQGACLALEYAARAGRSFRGVVALSGGLLGTGESGGVPSDALYGYTPKRFDYDSRLDGVPTFLGCHERDPHIPLARVEESVAVFKRLGAKVTMQTYPGAGHSVVEEEVGFLRSLLNR